MYVSMSVPYVSMYACVYVCSMYALCVFKNFICLFVLLFLVFVFIFICFKFFFGFFWQLESIFRIDIYGNIYLACSQNLFERLIEEEGEWGVLLK